ncbi:MAG: HAMP domain-containing sensor histidine kinase [Myxococcota bacterium]
MKRGPSIRRLLLGVGAFVLLVPVLAVVMLRIYETHLVEQTESRLIGEAVLIGEAFRDAWLLASDVSPGDAPSPAPPGHSDAELYPIEPLLVDPVGRLPAQLPESARRGEAAGPAWAAGQAIAPALDRARRFNLSGARVLDARGCVVASTGGDVGTCLDTLPEIRDALAGHYRSVVRDRETDSPPPPLGSISRRGRVRVSVALPLFSAGRVFGVVRMTRTSVDPVESLWRHRGIFLLALASCLVLTAAVTLYLSRRIAKPIEQMAAAAEAVAAGRPRTPFSALGTVPDEVASLSESLDRMTAQLTERAAYISEFASNVSHELKTPIAAIRGATELLRDDWDAMDEEQRARFLSHIDTDAERMQRLVSGLLSLARIESTGEPGAATALQPLLRSLAADYDGLVTVDEGAEASSSSELRVAVGGDHLEAALRNLLDNAAHHGGGSPVIVQVRREDSLVRVDVIDSGPGIAPANRERVFDRFFTTRRDVGGTGLGLPIVRAVARRHGGDVTFVSEPGRTVFTLTVPAGSVAAIS